MKKGKIAAVLAMPVKAEKASSPDMEAEEDSDSSVSVDAAQAVMDAINSKDAAALAKAFKDMLSVCME